jgi:hypothetical protein
MKELMFVLWVMRGHSNDGHCRVCFTIAFEQPSGLSALLIANYLRSATK